MRLVTIRPITRSAGAQPAGAQPAGAQPAGAQPAGATLADPLAPGPSAAAFTTAVLLDSGAALPLEMLARIAGWPAPESIGRLTLSELIAADPEFTGIRQGMAAASTATLEAMALPAGRFRFGAPIARPGKIIGVGYNYMDHIREQGLGRPARPVLFSMFANAVAGDGDPDPKAGGHSRAGPGGGAGRRHRQARQLESRRPGHWHTSPATSPRTTSRPATGRDNRKRCAPGRRGMASGFGRRARTRSCLSARSSSRRRMCRPTAGLATAAVSRSAPGAQPPQGRMPERRSRCRTAIRPICSSASPT